MTAAISALDHIGLEADWASAAMQLQEQATCIAENLPILVSTPKRSGSSQTILAHSRAGPRLFVSFLGCRSGRRSRLGMF